MNRSLSRVATAGALVACASMALATAGGGTAGASGTAPGVTAKHKTITLGVITPLSGPAALIGKPLTDGNKAYFDWFNAHGGAHGWKVKLLVKTDAYTPQKHVSDFDTEVTKVLFIAQSLGSPTTSAIESSAASQKVLLGTAAQDSSFVNHRINLVQGTPYAVTVANTIYYVTHTLHQSKAKFGIVYNNTAYGKDGLKGYMTALKAYHFTTVGAKETATAAETNFTSQATALKTAGAKYVVCTVLPTEAAYLIGTAALLGYHPQWILQGPAWSEYLMTTNGTTTGKPTAAEPAMQGAWVMGYTAPWGSTKYSGMKQMLAATQKYFPTQIPDGYYEYGYAQAWIEGQLIKKVVKSGHITRTGVLSAKSHLGTVSTGGLIPTAKYTPKNGPADRMTAIFQVTKTAGKSGFAKVVKGFFSSKVAAKMKFTSAATA